MLSLLRFYGYASAICAGLTLAGWLLFSAIRVAIRMAMPDLVALYEEESGGMQAWVLIIQWFILYLFNMMRESIVRDTLFSFPALLQPRFSFFVYYATALWLAAMVYLSWLIWSRHASAELGMILELLTIKVGFGIVMGTALPYCTARSWQYVRKKGAMD